MPCDISWAMTLDQAKPDFAYIHALNGNKIIIKGNHDYWFSTKKKVDDFLQENNFDTIKILFNNAFEFKEVAICGTRGWFNEKGEEVDKTVLNREAGRLKTSLEAAKSFNKPPIAFLHYPPAYYLTECEEIMKVLLDYSVSKCYYGHIHGAGYRYAIDGNYKGIGLRLVSCDYTQFNPVKVL
ncbi:MAG: metallophosphoesterase [Oscillospiraceae bacterium]